MSLAGYRLSSLVERVTGGSQFISTDHAFIHRGF